MLMPMSERITPRDKDFSQWYADVIQEAELADYSPVRGCMVLRPNGYALWEVVQSNLDQRFKETGHQNAYFPLLIPESFLTKEKDHVEGFAPQCAVVTHGGGKKLEEPLIVRPTSETIINAMYAKWIHSYRDLPVLINQWANVVRWELRTKPFLRTLEFLWQEGHTCHATEREAREETHQMLEIYREFVENVFAIPVIAGQKSSSEKFAGALETYCIEAMMQDKKALQAATAHYFGTKFAEAFGIRFQDEKSQMQYVHQTTWGISTRILGALIMTHSDDKGLVIPPLASPIPIVILPILRKESDAQVVMSAVHSLAEDVRREYRCVVDESDHSPGYKFHHWEVRGVPIRIEIGPKDCEKKQCVIARRDGEKKVVPLTSALATVRKDLEDYQHKLLQRAREFLHRNRFLENDYRVFQEKIEAQPGFYDVHWCGQDACETRLKEETKATIRCLPFDATPEIGQCLICHGESKKRVVVARNY